MLIKSHIKNTAWVVIAIISIFAFVSHSGISAQNYIHPTDLMPIVPGYPDKKVNAPFTESTSLYVRAIYHKSLDPETKEHAKGPNFNVLIGYDKNLRGSKRSNLDMAESGAFLYHHLDDWIIFAWRPETDPEIYGISFVAYKGYYSIHVNLYDFNSTRDAENQADKVFALILPRIQAFPDDSSSDMNANASNQISTTGNNQHKGKNKQNDSYTKSIEEQERDRRMEEIRATYMQERQEYIAAHRIKIDALKQIREEGKQLAEENNYSISSEIQIIPPSRQLILWREKDHYFGIRVQNFSDAEITNLSLKLYVNLTNGKQDKVATEKIEYIGPGSSVSKDFKINYRSLMNKIDNMRNTDVVIKSNYKVKWSKSYFSSEEKETTWNNAFNPVKDYQKIAKQGDKPDVEVSIYDLQGKIVPFDQLIKGCQYYIKTTFNKPEDDCLLSYGEPEWKPYIKKVTHSPWMNTNSYSLLEDLSGKMNHFNQENSPIFSGQMRKPNIWFYSLLSIPAKTKKESIQLTIPYRYSFELNLLNDDQYWDQVEKTFSFKVIEAQKDEALSHLLGVDVMPKRKENATIRLILNDGRIGHYSGEITWVEPVSPFWAEAKMKWIDQNEALNDFDYTKYLKTEEGVKYIAGELVNYYAEELKSMLDFSQQAESFASEGVNQKNVEGAASYVAGLYVPYADKIKSTLDMGKIFSKREREENKLLKVINKEIKNEVFTPGTLYREQGADGTRVFFKMKDDKLYLIELGISIL